MSTDILDIWVNHVTEQSAAQFLGDEANANIPGYLGGSGDRAGIDDLLERMDELGVATGILTPGLTRTGVEAACEAVRGHARADGTEVTQVELVGLVPAAELGRCSPEFLAWSGLDHTQTIEHRLTHPPEG